MFKWFQRKTSSYGAVVLPGNVPPSPEEFSFLAQQGIQVSAARPESSDIWALNLEHPAWGKAQMCCPREPMPSPKPFLKYSAIPTARETAEACNATRGVMLRTEPVSENVLRDRKNLLRYFGAVMDRYVILAIDLISDLPWTRATLADR